jgi:hypothetical protein
LTPPDPQLKGAWYPGAFNPCAYQVKKPVSKCAFQMQFAPLHPDLLEELATMARRRALDEVGRCTLTPPDP